MKVTTMRCPWLPDFPRRQQAVAKLFSRKRTQHRTFRPRIESLEDRLVPAVITVTGADGLTLGAGSGGSTIKGLDITNFPGNGIVVQSNGNFILGNFIGVDPTGTTRMPNGAFPNSGDGIRILNASNNQIGSTGPADR